MGCYNNQTNVVQGYKGNLELEVGLTGYRGSRQAPQKHKVYNMGEKTYY